jgi:hypothetical protein
MLCSVLLIWIYCFDVPVFTIKPQTVENQHQGVKNYLDLL